MTKFYCNLPQTEINFWTLDRKRITVKFHQNYFETDDAETIAFLSGYANQGVMVHEVKENEEPEIDYTPVFKDDDEITEKGDTKKKGKRR